jgi:NAD(P)-dependent dehydrogenase (short-subunit alcohol dehydrogenase family)
MIKIDLMVVTGASRGIGNAIASECSSFTKSIIALGSSDASEKLDFKCPTFGIKVDIQDIKIVKEKLIKELKFGKSPLRVGIVLCASQLGSPGGLVGADFLEWENIFRINVLGNLQVLQTVIEILPPKSILRVVFLAGGGAAYAYPEFSAYALSKVATVRAVENLGVEFNMLNFDASIIALAPGAVSTEMLAKVIANGGAVKTKTEMVEVVNFVRNFLLDRIRSRDLNGRFLHVRDNVDDDYLINNLNNTHFKLRRIE